MTVRSPNSDSLVLLERVLDDNEKYIGSAVFEELETVYEKLDGEVEELENELEEAKDRIKELEEEIKKANERIDELESEEG